MMSFNTLGQLCFSIDHAARKALEQKSVNTSEVIRTMMKNSLWKKTQIVLLSACFLLASGTCCFADNSGEVKKSLFQDAEKVMIEADSQKTRTYAPKIFSEAVDMYKSAENDFERGKSIREITEKLTKSSALFKQAMAVSQEGAELLGHAEAARVAAHKVMASKHKAEEWSKAEETFKRSVSKLEKGNPTDARILADQAEQLYRQVELDTVAFSYMIEIRDKLRKIETMKDGEYFAPKTYQKALSLARQAEEELARQPYANEKAKGLIKEAMDQADFGMKMSRHIKTLVKEKKTFEDLYLESVIPVETLDKTPGPS
jgi:hypothetical protein